jgi:hypothetical protein
MTTKHTLSTKTFCKSSVIEIAKITPEAKSYKTKNVPQVGKVVYIYNEEMSCIGHVYAEVVNGFTQIQYLVK